jgi:P pilus assembly chaperone PapD
MTLGMKVLSPTLATAAMLAAAGAAQAQGAIKPVEARIINTPTQSVPVTVLNAPTQPLPVTVLSAPAAPGEGSREIYSKVPPCKE